MENNLSESEKSWKETIKFLLENQCTREDLIDDCDGIELSDIGNTGNEIGGDFFGINNICNPTFITPLKQKEHLNQIIDKINEFKNKFFDDFQKRYKGETKFNIDDLALQENIRAVMSDVHGDYFALMGALVAIGAVSLFKNCFFYYDYENDKFINEKIFFYSFITNESYTIKTNSRSYYVIPIPYINPNFNGKIINLGDYIDRGGESIPCLITCLLLAQAMPNSIICLLGNHEALREKIDDDRLINLIDSSIEKNILKTGYIEKGIKDGEEIWHAYSHVIFTKRHLPKLFGLLYFLLNDKSEKFSSRICRLKKLIANTLFEKVENFFRSNILTDFFKSLKFKSQAIDVNFQTLVYQTKNTDYKKIYILFYESLLKFGFEDKEFFELKFALGDTFYNNFYDKLNSNRTDYLDGYGNEQVYGWIFFERYVPKDADELFPKIIQYIGHTPQTFQVVLYNNANYLDLLRSSGFAYENEKTYSRVYLLIFDNNNYEKFIISAFLERIYLEVSSSSEIILNKEAKIILETSPSNYSAGTNDLSQIIEYFNYKSDNAIKNKKGNPKTFSSTKFFAKNFFKHNCLPIITSSTISKNTNEPKSALSLNSENLNIPKLISENQFENLYK